MEYTDYKSGEKISRDQYIANGVERGELKVKEDCGCVVIQDRVAGTYIVYCHKHDAAPSLYAALKMVVEVQSDDFTLEQWELISQAMAEAEGGIKNA